MGVKDLWQLLAPAGRHSSLESLRHKRIAIDTSIWLVQFGAITDERTGKAIPHAQLRGLFHRICKLLFFGVKPVFVFDGGVPVLKRRTMVARQRLRDAQTEKNVTKVAERLLQQTLGEARYKELLEQSKNDKKRKAPHQRKSHQGSEPHSKKTKSDSEPSLSSSSSSSPAKTTKAEVVVIADEGESNAEDTIQWEGALGTPVPTRTELGGQVIEILRALGIDADVYASLPKGIQVEIMSNARGLEKQLSTGAATSHHSPEKFSEHQMLNLIKTGRLNRRMHQLRADVEATNRQTIASDADREFLLIKTTPAQQTAKEEGKRKAREGAESGTLPPAEDELVEIQHAPLQPGRRKEEQDELDGGAGGFLIDDDGDGDGNSQDIWVTRGRAEVDESGTGQVSEGGGFLVESDDDSEMDLPVGVPTGRHSPALSFEQTVHSADGDDDEHSLISRRRRMERQQALLSNMSGASSSEPLASEPHVPLFASPDTTTARGPTESQPNDDEDDAQLQMALESSLLEHRPQERAGPAATSKMETATAISKTRRKGDEHEEEELQRALELSLAESGLPTHARRRESSREGEETALVLDSCNTAEGDAIMHVRNDSPSQGVETGFRDSDDGDGDEIFIQVAMDESGPNPFDEIFGRASSDVASTPEKRQPGKKLDKGKEKLYIQSSDEDDEAETHRGSAARSAEVSATHAGEDTIVIDDDEADEEDNGGSLPTDVSLSYDDDEALAMLLQRQEEEEAMVTSTSGGTWSSEDQTDEDSAAIKRQFYEEMGMVGAKAGRTEDDVEREMSQEALTLSRRARAMHTTSSLTHDAITDCVTLLQLFGCPYVVAPMEAEAQCGFLDDAGLVHGVITEDSDIFLVGGQTVYRNVFSKRRQVEVYTMSDIKTHLALDREKLISLALLLGSDFTEGVKGVGVATAMEIIGLFNTLADFKAWWQASPDGDLSDLHAVADKRLGWLRTKVTLQHDFPSEAVAEAYRHPQVDESQERFEWGLPDIDGLRRFARGKMGWPDEKVDELVLPILKRFAEAEQAAQDPSSAGLQTSINDFFAAASSNRRLNPKIKSARVQNAVLRMLGREPEDESAGTSQHKTKRKRTTTATTKTGGREAVMVLQPRSTVVKRRAPSPTAATKKQKQQQQQQQHDDDAEDEHSSSSNASEELAANAEAEGSEGVKAMTVNELKAELRKRGQRVTGRKEELVQRLRDALGRERAWEEERKRTQQKEQEQEQDDDEEKREDEEPGLGEAHKEEPAEEAAAEEEEEKTVVDIVDAEEQRVEAPTKKSRRRIVIP